MATGTTHAGLIVSISTDQPPTYDQAGFEDVGITYTEIKQVITVGDQGREYADVTTKVLGERGTVHSKGTFDQGQFQMTLLDLTSDPGQALLDAGASGVSVDVNHTFKVEYNSGEIFYFQALVLSYKIIGGDGDTNRTAQSTLVLDTRGTIKV